MFYKNVDGRIFVTNYFKQKPLYFNKLHIKTYHDLTMKIIGLTQIIKAAHNIAFLFFIVLQFGQDVINLAMNKTAAILQLATLVRA